MKYSYLIIALVIFFSCKEKQQHTALNDFHIAGEMKNVMWKGMLDGIIQLDSIPSENLYGIGPIEHLSGEILIVNGKVYTSTIKNNESSLSVELAPKVKAPFFVYAHQDNWNKFSLPNYVNDLKAVEHFVDSLSAQKSSPFVFKLEGKIDSAWIHVQNLPPNTEVHSPKEAHQGQVNFPLNSEKGIIVGFFSRNHQGIFTHHDSYIHTHFINDNKSKMGHLDKVYFNPNDVILYMPK